MDYAIISTGGKQYKVAPGSVLEVELLDGDAGEKMTIGSVLAVRKGDKFKVGTPEIKGATVSAELVGQIKGKKVINFKYKRRKGYHRKVGHRQKLTRLKIVEISL